LTNLLDLKTFSTGRIPPTYSAPEIMGREFPALLWVIPEIIPAGLTLLAGKPKMGKSWLSLNFAHSVATGGKVLGHIAVEPQDVLYIALEDTDRRINLRLGKVLQGNPPPAGLHLAFEWKRMDMAGLTELRNWLKVNPETRLVIVDTLVRIRASKKKGSSYGSDYQEIAELKAIADEHKIAVVVVHHLRKAKADDVFDLVSGSTGITAAADNVILLTRERFQKYAGLSISGRDQEDQEFALEFDSESGSWTLVGETAGVVLSPERQEIVDLLMKAEGPMQLKDIAESLGKEKTNIYNLLKGLEKQGIVEKPSTGKYILTPKFIESITFIRTSESDEPSGERLDPEVPSEIHAVGSNEGDGSSEFAGERSESGDDAGFHAIDLDESDGYGVCPV
jgi:predicted transcriptional regulator